MRRLILCLLILPTPALAEGFEDLDQLDLRIAAAGIAAQPVDRRLRLARCPEATVIDPPIMGAVAVRCVPLGWRLRVVVNGASQGATLVRRGDAVELSITGRGFDIATGATALEDAALGAPVRVKSSTGAATLTGRVTGPGRVTVGD